MQFFLFLALIIAIAFTNGCALKPAANESPAAAATPTPSIDEPHMVTNLNEISSANTVAGLLPGELAPTPAATPAPASNANAETQRNIDRFFASTAPSIRYSGEPAAPPGETRLLNDKAKKFGDFSYALAKQTLTAVQTLEAQKLHQRKLSTDLRPVILTAVMTPQGRLTEISIDQHSGDIEIDQIFIDACKQGLWSRNPPRQALAGDQNYRVQVSGIIYNYSFDRFGKYVYETQLGLGLL